MKKLFTLMAAALFAVCVNAEEVDITSHFTYTWNNAESIVNNDDGSITFNAVAWGGLAGWFATDEGKADWSGYESITFEFAEATTVNTQILVGNAKAWGDVGITKLTCSFDGIDMSGVDQVALQASAETTITVKRIYLTGKQSYSEGKTLNIEDGLIKAGEFAGLSDDAKVEFTYTVAGVIKNPDGEGWEGWGIGRIGSNDDEGNGPSVVIATLNVNVLGDQSFICKFADIKSALEATPEGIRVWFWDFGSGACTASLAKVASFEVEGFSGEGYVPAISATWTVAGNFVGSSWDPSDTNNDMTSEDGTTYTLVKEGVTLEAGTSYQFKVVKNHDWTEAYPGDNYTFTVEETGIYTVTITFNTDTKEVSHNAVKTGDAGPVEHTYSVIGTINGNWDTDTDMTKGDDGLFTTTFTDVMAGTYKFKVRVDHDWAISYPNSDYEFTVDNDGSTVTITFNEDTKEVIATVSTNTGIETVKTINMNSAVRYNLAGQKVDTAYKGVVIENGRKFVVK